MIDCPNGDIRDLLPDLVHGRLDAAERERVEMHVAACEACQQELALLRDMRATMRRVPAVDASAIAASIPAYRAPVRRTWTSWRSAAAIATIAIGGTSIAIATRQPEAPQSTELAQVVPAPSTPSPAPLANAPNASGAASPRTAEPSPSGTEPTATSTTRAPIAERPTRELAMGGGTVSDLSDGELTALLNDIESLDALPSADVETALPVTPLPPTRGAR